MYPLHLLLAITNINPRLRGEVGIPCVKNALMASTIVVTSGVNVLPPNEEQIPKLCDHILESLSDPFTSTIAIQCVRPLVMASPKTACDQEVIRYLLPKLIAFVTSPSNDTATKSAICGILTSFVRILSGDQTQVAVALFVPMLLERARVENSVGRETAGRLLELAQFNQQAFKTVVANLDPQQRSFMEEVLRSNVVGRQEKVKPESAQPSIALKMNFG